MTEDTVQRLLVVGTGLIGTSVALGARAAGLAVWLDDVDTEQVELAVARGAGQAGLPTEPPDVVLVAVPPGRTGQVLKSMMSRYLNSTFTDVSSVKTKVINDTKTRSVDRTRFVPGHPLAGGEVSGPAAARADLFADRVWVLTPDADADPARVESVAGLASALGAVVVMWDAAAHDRAVALTSHLPQLVSSLLAAQLAEPGAADPRLSGQGLRDMTRIAGSDADMWTQILETNAGQILEVLTAFERDLAGVASALRALAAGDGSDVARQVVTDALVRGNRGRELIPGKHGTVATPTATLVVAVADRPGELGRLFAAVGSTGTNLEDVRIDHALGRPTGLVELAVSPQLRARLVTALREQGWDVRE